MDEPLDQAKIDQLMANLDDPPESQPETETEEEKPQPPTAQKAKEVQSPSLAGFSDNQIDSDVMDIDFILDIPLQLSVELGRTRIVINDLLHMGKGAVIELNRVVGDPVEILINDKPMARGEVVVVNEKFGVRLTDIITPTERIEQLR